MLLAASTTVGTVTLLEAVVRGVIDDGRQLDLEMWKYARDVKRVAADPDVGHEHRPGARARLMGVDVVINDQKLRDREIGFERQTGRFRILMLGDSLVFGWGVPAEATIPKRLEDLLNGAGIQAEVLNAGVGNYNTSMETAYYLAEGRRYHADLVLLGYFINDAERRPRYDAGWPARESAAYAYITARLDVLLRMMGVGEHANWRIHFARIYDPADLTSGWPETMAAFDRLGAAARADDVRIAVVNLPELHQLRHYPFAEQEAKVRSLAEAKNFAYLDLLPAVADLEPSTLWVAPDDTHPNAKADEIYASSIFRFLQSNGLLPTRDVVSGQSRR
jgi:lysophospholipase L1-like esterase